VSTNCARNSFYQIDEKMLYPCIASAGWMPRITYQKGNIVSPNPEVLTILKKLKPNNDLCQSISDNSTTKYVPNNKIKPCRSEEECTIKWYSELPTYEK